MLLDHLDSIELHHRPHSAEPPYAAIEVFGTQLSAKTRNVLSECGFSEFRATSTGFTATKLSLD